MTISNPASFSSIQGEAGSAVTTFSSYVRGGSIISTNWSTLISTTANGLAVSQFNGLTRPSRTTTFATAVTSSYTTSWTTQEYTFGCVVEGTEILMADGTTKLIEEIRPFDELASLLVPGLQPETVEDYEDYHSTTRDGLEPATTHAASIYGQDVTVIFEIRFKGRGRPLCVTREHPFLVWDDEGTLRFCTAEELDISYLVFDKSANEVVIESIDIRSGNFKIFKLDCSPLDLFVHEGIVGHNLKPGETNPMDHLTTVTGSRTTSVATTRSTSRTTYI